MVSINKGDLISAIDNTSWVYVHSGISSVLTGSVLCTEVDNPQGMTYGASGIIVANWTNQFAYRYQDVSSTLLGSFSTSSPQGLAFDKSGNVLAGNNSNSDIYVHNKETDAVTATLTGGGGRELGLTVDLNNNMISDSDSTNFIYVYSGISSTITGSFPVPFPGAWAGDLAVDTNGNLISTDGTYIYQHSGISSTLLGSFAAIASTNGLVVYNPLTANTYTKNIIDSLTFTETITKKIPAQSYKVSISETLTFSETIAVKTRGNISFNVNVTESLTFTETISVSQLNRNTDFKIYSAIKVNGNIIANLYPDQIEVNKTMDEFDATSNFSVKINNYAGSRATSYNLNDEITIFADLNLNPPTTKIFTGIIEDISYAGEGLEEKIVLSGRDFGAILMDIMVSPRIFKKQEISAIIRSLMIQNATGTGITWNNVNVTTVTLDKITFNNKSLYDCIKELSGLAGFYFYVDVNKDLHFEQKSSISSGETFSRGNILYSDFTDTDADLFNKVTYYGARTLTGYRQTYPTVSNGSTYVLDAKPSNVFVIGSNGTVAGSVLQPGGVLEFANPATENIKWLVDYDNKKVILTSGTTAGDNTGWVLSGIIIDYQRSTPLISIKQDIPSQTTYGRKEKVIIDGNLKTLAEVSDKATTFLNDHKNPILMGHLEVYGVLNITPGNTCIVNMPFNNINNQVYTILEAKYKFNIDNNFNNRVLTLKLNKKVKNFIDYFKDQELRLRALESSNIETSVTETVVATGSVTPQVSSWKIISTSIGSAFYFGIAGHNIFNSPSSLLGVITGGSTVLGSP